MKTEDLNYELPEELIAQSPCRRRARSRLLVLDRPIQAPADRLFSDLPEYLNPGDCLVLNDTRVLPARFYSRKETGAFIEGLYLHTDTEGRWVVLFKNSRRLKEGRRLILLDKEGRSSGAAGVIQKLDGGQWILEPESDESARVVLARIGFAPLPPYIHRDKADERSADDLFDYQTVYARRPGAVAAPTAGLHFDSDLLERISQMGVRLAYVTLHVGIGTFRPVQTETLEEHPMHSEQYELTEEAAGVINETVKQGGRIIAVGTTSVRTLETIARDRQVTPQQGSTRLFIQPGYQFQIVDAMVTNFHLPKSTLLALVAAFAGLDTIKQAYHHAVEQRYRFFSYGDAMLIF